MELLTLGREIHDETKKEVSWRDMSDETLLYVSLNQSPEAFSFIVDRYRDAFLRKAKTILKDDADAEDALQEALVKLYIKGNQFRKVPGASFNSWAYKVLINTCLSAYRKRARRNETYAFEDIAEFVPDAGSARESESALSYDAFLSVVSRLPEQFASFLKKLVLAGRAPRDVAYEEGVTVSAIRTRLHRARKAFEKVRIDSEHV